MKIYLFIYNIYPKITLLVLPAPLPPLRFWYFSRRKVQDCFYSLTLINNKVSILHFIHI